MASISAPLPRVTIQFCTQCKWMLRAAYFAQELLSTFGTALGEVALQPSTGGTFIVSLYSSLSTAKDDMSVQRHVLWDRKAEGRFPETKELKRRIRDIIEPGRDLGHVDGKKKSIVGAYTTALEHRSQGLNQNEDPIEADPQKKETDGEEEVRLPHAISNIEVHGHESERKYTPMDLNNIEMRDERRETDVKRNPDGSICEDCN